MMIELKRVFSLISFSLLLLSSGCQTNPPNAPQEPVIYYGKVFVSSNAESAAIYVDNVNSGKFTPDTIETVEGLRIIKLIKDGFLSSVLEVNVIRDSIISTSIEMQPILNPGKVFVTSNVQGAEIFIDDVTTERFTPDTVEASSGIRVIKLVKAGYITSEVDVDVIQDSTISINIDLQQTAVSKVVLLEDFANVSCIPCVTSNKITHSLSQSYQGKLHIVKFPTNFPKPTDPFYLAAKPDCDSRMSFYSIITAPTIIIDGVTRPVPSDSNAVKEAIDNALQQAPAFDISVYDSIDGGNIYVKISIAPVNTSGINYSDYVIHTAIIEKRIDTGTPPGSNGESVFYDVLRKMLPSSSGLPLQESNLSTTTLYENQTQISSSWNMNEITTIVYIQNKNTKQVLQASSDE